MPEGGKDWVLWVNSLVPTIRQFTHVSRQLKTDVHAHLIFKSLVTKTRDISTPTHPPTHPSSNSLLFHVHTYTPSNSSSSSSSSLVTMFIKHRTSVACWAVPSTCSPGMLMGIGMACCCCISMARVMGVLAPTLARWTTSFLSPSCIPLRPAMACKACVQCVCVCVHCVCVCIVCVCVHIVCVCVCVCVQIRRHKAYIYCYQALHLNECLRTKHWEEIRGRQTHHVRYLLLDILKETVSLWEGGSTVLD